ncbi:unnamed protein product [Rotaria socialis]|uniref:Uncharacterized protein n=1 Tax=Rotaria socialis TaxID=392032 RepID=A0A821W1P0_9BILA|nr:unnamed protein product [Rotaria socialis]
MKRTTTDSNNIPKSTTLVALDGYIVHINPITKNNTNDNHHYSFIICLEDQSTVKIMEYLSKVPFCFLYNRLQESIKNGRAASITSLRQQNNQYTCTISSKLIDKDLNFRPDCIRVKTINMLKKETNDQLCTVEAKVCSISDEVAVVFEQNQFKRVQKMKKKVTIGDSTGALEMTIWDGHFNQLLLGNSYHIKLLKVRVYSDQISLTGTTDTSFITIDDLPNVIDEVDSTIHRYKTEKGKIVSILKNDNHYICQCCGGINIIDQAGVVSCNDCHSRLLKDKNIVDDYFKISISTMSNEQYNLKITKSLLMLILSENNSDFIQPNDCFDNEPNFNDCSLTVQFTYSETTGIISDISILNDIELHHQNDNAVEP